MPADRRSLTMDTGFPVLQLALDFVNTAQALRAAEEAAQAGPIWLEAGTPLIKSEGLNCVRSLRAEFPEHTIIADMKVMDAGRAEVEMAAQAGANVVAVLGAASDSTIEECVEAGERYGVRIMVDLAEVADPVARAVRAQELGASIIAVHCPIDVQMRGGDPFDTLEKVAAAVQTPVAVAGGVNSETAARAIHAGASIVIVGGAINKAPDATQATAQILQALRTGEGVATDQYKRAGAEQLRETLARVNAANVSDAQHRKGWLPGIMPIDRSMRCVGPAFTVWTYPGDWNKPVQAIDHAKPGDVLVIDVRGEGPAVWGDEASKSAVERGIAGVVIHGALRDSEGIREVGLPAFSSLICPAAGDPKGMGMMGVSLKIGETSIRPGDWIVADADGVVVVPQERAVEVANRSLAVIEREAREKAEIMRGSTLGQVAELEKWEQKRGKNG